MRKLLSGIGIILVLAGCRNPLMNHPIDLSAMSGIWQYEYIDSSGSEKERYTLHVYESGKYLTVVEEGEGSDPYQVVNDISGTWYYNEVLGEVSFFESFGGVGDEGWSLNFSYDLDSMSLTTDALSGDGVFEKVSDSTIIDEDTLRFIQYWGVSRYDSYQDVSIDRDNHFLRIYDSGSYTYPSLGDYIADNGGDTDTVSVTSHIHHRYYLNVWSDGSYSWEYRNYYFFDYDEDGIGEGVYIDVRTGDGSWSVSGDIISFDNGVDGSTSMTYEYTEEINLVDTVNAETYYIY